MTNIQLKKVTKSFGAVKVIKGVDLEIREGELMVFVGPSGCGKSTLLRIISGLEEISDGKLLFDHNEMNTVLPSKRGVSMVFQSYALYPHMSVFDNMAFGLKLSKSSKDTIRERVHRSAEMLQITELLDRKPRQLSGGQRQRVAIGRAIVREPKVFLFDEPLSNLDAALRVATRLEIANLHKRMDGVTMIYVTHDQVEAMTLADRICALKDGQIMQVGTPSELYDSPNSLFVAGFIGSPKMNFLTGKEAKEHDCSTLGIRPEHIEIVANDKPSIWSGQIIHAEELGADHFLYVDIGSDEPLIVRQPGKFSKRKNTTVSLAPQAGKLHLFGQDGRPIR